MKLVPGDLVLALETVDGKPLHVRYSGPHKVLKQTSNVDYLVEFLGTRKVHRNLHVNMLRKYFVRTEFNAVTHCEVSRNEQGESVFSFNQPTEDDLLDDDNLLTILHPTSVTDSILDDKLSHLPILHRSDMKNLLLEHKHVFSDKPGLAKVDPHEIRLKPDAKVVRLAPYRVAPHVQDKLRVEIANLLKDGLIQEAESEWASPTIVISKPDKSIRAVIDYRQANEQFVGDSYPIPHIDTLISRIGTCCILSKIDLTRGFYQIPLAQSSRKFTAFVCPFGTYVWTRLPYGLKTSPTKFQRIMNQVLAGLEAFCVVYIDDIIAFSKTWKEHVIHVRLVLQRLAAYYLTGKLSKSDFGKPSLDFVGHLVGQGQMTPRDAKIKDLADAAHPVNRKQLHSFVGLATYFSRYCPKFADVMHPLTELLRKNRPFVWTTAAEESFLRIKRYLTQQPVLSIADYTKPFFVFVDASNDAVGSALCQLKDGQYHPVCYSSMKLNPAQRNYNVTDKEALALITAIRTFKPYLSEQFTVFSDHEPLSFINKMAIKNSRIMRWALELSPYTITVSHIPGKNNCIADFLSRSIQ